jgi:hypothetical protein
MPKILSDLHVFIENCDYEQTRQFKTKTIRSHVETR